MAEEKTAQETAESPRRSIVSTLIVAAIIFAVAGGGGFLVFRLVIAPRLVVEHAEEHEPEPAGDIPLMPVAIEFPQKFVNIMRDSDEAASTLVFQITIECNNQATADLINLHRVRFEDMLIKLHDSRTRDELDDTLALKTSIQAQAKQKANDLLLRLGPDPELDIRVTEVFHNLFMVQDQN